MRDIVTILVLCSIFITLAAYTEGMHYGWALRSYECTGRPEVVIQYENGVTHCVYSAKSIAESRFSTRKGQKL